MGPVGYGVRQVSTVHFPVACLRFEPLTPLFLSDKQSNCSDLYRLHMRRPRHLLLDTAECNQPVEAEYSQGGKRRKRPLRHVQATNGHRLSGEENMAESKRGASNFQAGLLNKRCSMGVSYRTPPF